MGSIQRVDRSKPWRARYWGPDGRQHSKSFARKVDAERWLKVSEAESLTGRWSRRPLSYNDAIEVVKRAAEKLGLIALQSDWSIWEWSGQNP